MMNSFLENKTTATASDIERLNNLRDYYLVRAKNSIGGEKYFRTMANTVDECISVIKENVPESIDGILEDGQIKGIPLPETARGRGYLTVAEAIRVCNVYKAAKTAEYMLSLLPEGTEYDADEMLSYGSIVSSLVSEAEPELEEEAIRNVRDQVSPSILDELQLRR